MADVSDLTPFAVLRANSQGCFKILQITDLHTDADPALTEKTYDDVRQMVEHFGPNLLAVTGDVWCSDEQPELGPERMQCDLARLGALGVPWAFAWGNHDYYGDFPAALRSIADTPNAVAPYGDGRGNFRIEIRAGNADVPVWDLYFLNSHTLCLLPQDLEWLNREAATLRALRGKTLPALAYFHIALKQYEWARQAGRVVGLAQEDVSFWGDDGTLFDGIRRAGGVRACFVGHDHTNDFYCEEDGIILTYGRVTGHGGYGGDKIRRGGKLVTLDGAADLFTFQTIFPDGSIWDWHG